MAKCSKKRIPLELEFDFTNSMAAFGAMVSDETAPRKIVVNMAAILWECTGDPDTDWKRLTADVVLHELLHAVQHAVGRFMDEDEVAASIDRARGIDPATIPATEPDRELDPYETTLARAEAAEREVDRLKKLLA